MLLMGKSTISMAIFNCYVSSPEGKLNEPGDKNPEKQRQGPANFQKSSKTIDGFRCRTSPWLFEKIPSFQPWASSKPHFKPIGPMKLGRGNKKKSMATAITSHGQFVNQVVPFG